MPLTKISPMIYDSVLCVAMRHKDIALKAIRSLHLFTQSRKIFVITSHHNFTFFEDALDQRLPVYLLDEDNVIENINLGVLQDYFTQRIGTPLRSGWYFQQFLKMSISNLPDTADHYLIWDSDTILLRSPTFFDPDGTVLINPKIEDHKPYFEVLKKTLGMEKQVDFSFISEHLMINKSYMSKLIHSFTTKASGETSWVELILNSIDDDSLGASGFSEFETYGNFIALNYKDSFKCRSIKSTRNGALHFGMNPNRHDILLFMLAGHTFVTFESWQAAPSDRVARNQVLSRIIYHFCLVLSYLAKYFREQIDAANQICH
jgi:Family of unknown function (DUF6492)